MLSEGDWWEKWFRRRSWWPFTGRWRFADIDETFREMEEVMRREFEELSKRAPKKLFRERTLLDGTKVKEWGPFVYGYSMTIGPEGKPRIREFGNLKPGEGLGRPRIDLKEEREPLVDILESDREIKVIAELLGVEKEDVQLHGTESSLTISVDTPQRKYHKEVELPAAIDPKQARSSYKNGVLEVSMPKKAKEKPKVERISIE